MQHAVLCTRCTHVQHRPDVNAVVHTHTPAIVAVACLKDGLKCYDQAVRTGCLSV